MNRRNFVATTVAAGFAPAIQAATAGRRLRVGMLGLGHPHSPGKLKVLRSSSDWELVGIADDDESLARQHAEGARVMATKELLNETEVVVVGSRVSDHFRHARLALEAGRHVHLEKPPATTTADFRTLVELAARQGRRLQMGYMWRYHPGFGKLFELVRNNWLGDISLVRGTMNSLYDKAPARKELAQFRGGGMLELGCHLIDQLVRLLGEPRNVTTTHRTHGGTDSLVDNSVAVFEFQRALGLIHINLLQPGAGPHRTFEVIGTRGTARLQPIEPPTLLVDLAQAAGPYRRGAQTVPLPRYERYVPELADLADAVRENRPLAVSPAEDLLVHHWVMRACDMQ